MKKYILPLAVAGFVFVGFQPAYADHNSRNGEGWANMPNDVHNTRIDTMDSDDSTFTDFVRYGGGASSVNRFLSDEDTVEIGFSSPDLSDDYAAQPDVTGRVE